VKYLRFLVYVSCVAVLITACQTPGAKAYYRGNDAYARGDYYNSFSDYLYAANQEIVPAQYALGYQYYYGLGTKRDEAKGIRWFLKAKPHSRQAEYALYLIDQKKPLEPWLIGLKGFSKR